MTITAVADISRFRNPDDVDLSQAARDRQWLASLGLLHQFVAKHGRRPTIRSQAGWRENQPGQFLKGNREHLKAGTLAQWRKQALDAVCPGWEATTGNGKPWDVLAAELVTFRGQTGTTPDPFSDDRDEATLGRWFQKRAREAAVGRSSGAYPDPLPLSRVPEFRRAVGEWRGWFRTTHRICQDLEVFGNGSGRLTQLMRDLRCDRCNDSDYDGEYCNGAGSLWTGVYSRIPVVWVGEMPETPVPLPDVRAVIIFWLTQQQEAEFAGRLPVVLARELDLRLKGWRTFDTGQTDIPTGEAQVEYAWDRGVGDFFDNLDRA